MVVSVGKGVLLRAGYGEPSSVPVTGRPPRCQLRGALLGAGYGAPSLCRLRGTLLGAGYGLTAVDKTQNPCLGLPLRTSQTFTSPVRAAELVQHPVCL